MSRILPLVFVLFVVACGTKPHPENTVSDSPVKVAVKIDSTRKGLNYAKAMTMVRKSAYDDFYIRIGDTVYNCNYKGVFTATDTVGNVLSALFDLKAEFLIDKMYFFPVGSDLYYLSWQETDHIGVCSYYALFKKGNDTPVWKKEKRAHSPGPPVIDSNSVYISSLGMIGKVDLYSGEFKWKYDSLFDPITIRFKEFDRPLIYTNTVCFFDFPVKGKKYKRDSIWVNDNSGKIVR